MKFIKNGAFTLLELVMVIVIMGIVGMMATNIIANVYKNYIISYRVNELQAKTETLLEQIGNRLKYRIKDSTIARETNDYSAYKKLSNATPDSTKSYILEWIGYSNEALRGKWDSSIYKPAYSGFIDVDSTDTNRATFSTPGSNLTNARDILYTLSNTKVDLNDNAKPAVLYFDTIRPIVEYWDNASVAESNTTFQVIKNSDTKFDLTTARTNSIDIYERYYLAWSAYAIVPRKAGSLCNTASNVDDARFDLCLYYNYQPWLGDGYIDGSVSLLMENVTSFRFRSVDNFIRIKVCVNEGNTTASGLNIQKNNRSALGFCKEKAIF